MTRHLKGINVKAVNDLQPPFNRFVLGRKGERGVFWKQHFVQCTVRCSAVLYEV